jgi:sigma-B regulation protein RsbU (phosphoserine phosphatase)
MTLDHFMETACQTSARLVLNIDGAHQVIPIDKTPFTLGRGADRDLSLPYPQVSREHACIERDAEGYLLRDTGSRHGTFLNGMQISNTRLHSHDTINLGRSHGVLLFEDIEESTVRTLIGQISQTGSRLDSQSDLEKLSLFLKAAQSLNTYGAINDVLRTMVEYAIRITAAERGFVFLGESAEGLRLEWAQDRHGETIVGHPTISFSIVRQAANSQLDFIVSDVTEEMGRQHESLVLHAIRSVVAIPLRGQSSGRLLGLLYLDSHSGSHDFTHTGNDILHAIASQAATLVENLRMIEVERESALLRKELEIAASIQRQIIPQTLPEFPFARLCARTIPCTGVGGDFYDVIPIPNGFVAIVADVCGKGVPAALLASMVQGMFHAQVNIQNTTNLSLVDAVQSVNTFVCSRVANERYLTLAVLRYTHVENSEAQIELVNGGHVSPLVVRADGRIETITDGDLPVGLLDFARFHSLSITLAVGDRIILLSDGINEAENVDGVQFGLPRVECHVMQPDPVGALFSALDQFCQGARPLDDQTVLSIDRTA